MISIGRSSFELAKLWVFQFATHKASPALDALLERVQIQFNLRLHKLNLPQRKGDHGHWSRQQVSVRLSIATKLGRLINSQLYFALYLIIPFWRWFTCRLICGEIEASSF